MFFAREDLNKFEPNNIDVPIQPLMMCLNESPYNPFDYFQDKIFDKIRKLSINRYFSNFTNELFQKLATYSEVEIENLLIGNGADELLYYFFIASRKSSNSHIVAPAPSYFDYHTYSRAVGLGCKSIDLNQDFSINTDNFITHLQNNDAVAGVICNPNNPSGNIIDSDSIIRLLDSTNKPILIDEAYFEFSGITHIKLIKNYPHLLILRSFSKGFLSAGLRFGYILGSDEIIYELSKVKTAFNISRLTEIVALTYLENQDWFVEKISELQYNRKYLYDFLSSLSKIEPFESYTNFISFRVNNHKDDLFNFLKSNEIAIRDVSGHKLLKDCLRVTVGSIAECEKFCEIVNLYFE